MTSFTETDALSPVMKSEPSPSSIIRFQVLPPSSDQPMFCVFR